MKEVLGNFQNKRVLIWIIPALMAFMIIASGCGKKNVEIPRHRSDPVQAVKRSDIPSKGDFIDETADIDDKATDNVKEDFSEPSTNDADTTKGADNKSYIEKVLRSFSNRRIYFQWMVLDLEPPPALLWTLIDYLKKLQFVKIIELLKEKSADIDYQTAVAKFQNLVNSLHAHSIQNLQKNKKEQ